MNVKWHEIGRAKSGDFAQLINIATLGSGSLITGGVKAGIKGLGKEIIEEGAEALAKEILEEGAEVGAKKALEYSDNLLEAAQKLYPKKAGKMELHHIEPKYLGGAKNGALSKIDGAYHQQITNAFRELRGYGKGPVSPELRQKFMDQVYSQFPLPK